MNTTIELCVLFSPFPPPLFLVVVGGGSKVFGCFHCVCATRHLSVMCVCVVCCVSERASVW